MITFQNTSDDRGGKISLLENDNAAGVITYVWTGEDKIIIDHTETFEGFNGKGYGKKLVYEAIFFAKEKGIKIIPLCPYANKVMHEDSSLHGMIYQ